jgi:hypothetical protein
MAPRNGPRRSGFSPEQIAWHLFSVGIIGLMLLVLLITVQSLGDPDPSVESAPVERARAPSGESRNEPDRDQSAVGRGLAPADRIVAAR